ncbi:hypothetical protein LASUN_16330 [Lentilactobacillus sunkii]|uniref:Uncharacterized protein n=1 Tax=Lentilactobacillus sunkii TaxID=481719 RepID=A0A1E7XC79_9LACO|nr:hypothetical protein [Lentilactobacillus sunkii]OFA10726.1 hypothetical protein LASUN_16330 [Lentilactobacillus sunkii]
MKRYFKLSIFSFALILGLLIGFSNIQTASARATIPYSLRGHYYRGGTNLRITARHIKMGHYSGHVSYVTRATHGYWHVHFTNQQPLWFKHGYRLVKVRYMPNDSPQYFYRY